MPGQRRLGDEQLDLVAFPAGRFHGVPLVEGHIQAHGLAEAPDRGRKIAGRNAKPDQTFTPIGLQDHTKWLARLAS
jgi:hypothetical protein